MSPNAKKILIVCAVLVVILWVVRSPNGAAESVSNVGTWFGDGAANITQFVQNVFSP